MMFGQVGQGQSHMAPRLTRNPVAEAFQALGQLGPGHVPRQPHAAITSSRVKCKRITPGTVPLSK